MRNYDIPQEDYGRLSNAKLMDILIATSDRLSRFLAGEEIREDFSERAKMWAARDRAYNEILSRMKQPEKVRLIVKHEHE